MFNSRTVFVIGAGASKEAGLPTGAELTKAIVKKLNIEFDSMGNITSGDRGIVNALRKHNVRDLDAHVKSARQISAGLPLVSSIDDFLDIHRDDARIQLCGKLAIVKAILEAERKSRLYADPRAAAHPPEFGRIAASWFVKFFQVLNNGVSKAAIDSLFDRISIINFNYDRCVEYFLVRAIRAVYGVDERDAQRVFARLSIFHPYGVVGLLPWQNNGLPFGEDARSPDVLLRLSQGIRIYTERVREGDTVAKIRQQVAEAEVIVFLGFAFHRQNMDLMTPPKTLEAQRIYGTTKGMSGSDNMIAGNQAAKMVGAGNKTFTLRDLTCSELFDEFGRTLSMA